MAKVPADDTPFKSLEKPYTFFRGLRHRYLDAKRREKPDPLPVSPPLGYKKTPSLSEQIRDMVRSEKLRQAAEEAGVETFEEADDFDIPDDPVDPSTPYEADFEGDAAQAVRDALKPQTREYGSVEEFLAANPNVKIASDSRSQMEPAHTAPQGGPATTVIADGGAPTAPSASEPQSIMRPGFFRRG